MKGEKITSLDELWKAAVEERKVVDWEGDERPSELYSIKYSQELIEKGLYIKEPEPPKCPYCKVDMTLRSPIQTGIHFYCCDNLGCPVYVHGPKRDTPEKAAEALRLPETERLTDEEIEEEVEEAVREFKDKEATIAIIYRRGMKRARDIMEGRA